MDKLRAKLDEKSASRRKANALLQRQSSLSAPRPQVHFPSDYNALFQMHYLHINRYTHPLMYPCIHLYFCCPLHFFLQSAFASRSSTSRVPSSAVTSTANRPGMRSSYLHDILTYHSRTKYATCFYS